MKNETSKANAALTKKALAVGTNKKAIIAPRRLNLKPLTKRELRDYQLLLKVWTTNGGARSEILTPDEIARFSMLSDRHAEEVRVIEERATREVIALITDQLTIRSTNLWAGCKGSDVVKTATHAAVQAAIAARKLLVKQSLGEQVAPLGYYLADNEICHGETVIVRDPKGGISIRLH